MRRRQIPGDVVVLIDRLRDQLRAERVLREQLDASRRVVVDLLGALAANRIPRIAIARRVAPALGYGTSVGDLLAAVDVLRKLLARAPRRGLHREKRTVDAPTAANDETQTGDEPKRVA